ncbi:DUF4136 domain-containing protein [Crenobacter caeni]|uniref:DUF4136 domain-containing protein n=1 Tax=Crenobacter caeni TaxID=2705474 RepID=A0A6B2KME9_9NEIS|nr:DUF4136 domain-containing protein [Crenobacter caeni]NDV11396.1 DUF4136 domain-containing protein [Crenobacter caeni]
MWNPSRFMAAGVLAGTLAACATQTTVQSQWRDPGYTGGPIRSAVVLAVGGSPTERRVFEDTVAQEMNTRGVNATPAWSLLPPSSAPLPEPVLEKALADSQAQALLLVRLMPLKTDYRVVDQPVWGPGPMWGWYGFYQGPWSVPMLQSYQLADTQTSLWDVKSRRLLWSGDMQAFDPSSVAASAQSYAKTLGQTLQQAALLPTAPAQ